MKIRILAIILLTAFTMQVVKAAPAGIVASTVFQLKPPPPPPHHPPLPHIHVKNPFRHHPFKKIKLPKHPRGPGLPPPPPPPRG